MAFKFIRVISILLLFFPDNVLLSDAEGKSVGISACEAQRRIDCYDIYLRDIQHASGVYTIQPMDGRTPFQVYCDMETDGGGWTVFQRRRDGSLDFYRYWNDYKDGFGFPAAEFWLGNDRLYRLTNQQKYELRIDLEDFEGETRYAKYDNFIIGDEFSEYKLILGNYSGNAGDSLRVHRNQSFSTRDRDNDKHSELNCAATFTGAWWYVDCHDSNLNGKYLGGENEEYATGIIWSTWKGDPYSLKSSEMKIKPVL